MGHLYTLSQNKLKLFLYDIDVLNDLLIEKGLSIPHAFIEKDWYAVQMINILSDIQIEGITLIFGGGTSLSKGYNLIKRFSEDLDFVLYSPTRLTKQNLSEIKKIIAEIIKKYFTITEITAHNANKFIQYDIQYPIMMGDSRLRPFLKLEIIYEEPKLPWQEKPVHIRWTDR